MMTSEHVLFGLALARGLLVVAGSRIATRRTVGF